MKLARKVGSTSQILQIFVRDSSSSTGGGLTGLAFNTASLTAYYHRDTDTTATAISLVTMTVGTFTSSGFKEIDATNMPGWYQFCPPNAALASGAASVVCHLKGASNMAPLPLEIDLDAQVDLTHILGTAVSTPATAGILDVNAKNINNVATTSVTTINANQGTTQPLNFTGTAGSALVKSDMVDVAGAAVSATTAQIGVNVVNWNNTVVATPATAGIPDINVKNINNVAAATPGASGGILISGSNSGTTTLAALTCTGSFTISDGLLIARSSSNTSAITATGNGTGSGAVFTSGSGATGDGFQATAASTNGNGFKLTKAGSGNDLAATSTTLTLAKTTNITGFNDIAATAIVSAGAITTSSGAVSTVTTVTNQLTAAAIATGIWQDSTAGDFTTASSIGKSLYTSGVVPGGTNGLFIAGTNAATTVTTALTTTFTGNLTGSVGSVTGAVGSVTGAVGSVTGNVGGNVVGSVASVTARVTANVDQWNGTTVTQSIPPDANFIRSGTAQAGAATTITLDAGASATNNLYQNETIFIRSGTGAGQSNIIASYVGATKVATVAATWATNPDNTSVFTVMSNGPSIASVSGTVNANVTQWSGTNVASPATAGIPEVNVKNINNVAAATPGASGGVLISGSNSGTTTLAALTVTGATTMTGGLVVNAGATITGSANGVGLTISGGGTSGAGLVVNTTSGDAIQVTPTAGHGVNIAANGTSKHGITSTGGTAGTSDGIKAAAGSGGVDIRGAVTGNITGNLSGSVGSVTGLTASNLDATITSRMATYTQPTGFLAATFPSGTVANTTNITAGTITTVTNLTNAPTAGDFTATMKTSIGTAVAASAVASVTAPVTAGTVSDKTGYALSASGNNAVADATLNRDMSAVSDTNARSPLNALRFLRNKWSIATGTLTVTKEDDTTSAWTGTVTTDAAALPITGEDPA